MPDPIDIATQGQEAGAAATGVGVLALIIRAAAKLWRVVFGSPKDRAEAKATEATATERVVEAAWRLAAALTRTTADDTGVKVLAVIWSVALLVPRFIVWATPIFASALESAKKGPQKRTGGAILGGLLTLVLLAGALLTTSGCGPAQAQALHSGLTDTTDLVDPMYAQAVVECDLQEREVIASHAPDQGDAAAVALAAVRVRCDVALASFEALRGAPQFAVPPRGAVRCAAPQQLLTGRRADAEAQQVPRRVRLGGAGGAAP